MMNNNKKNKNILYDSSSSLSIKKMKYINMPSFTFLCFFMVCFVSSCAMGFKIGPKIKSTSSVSSSVIFNRYISPYSYHSSSCHCCHCKSFQSSRTCACGSDGISLCRCSTRLYANPRKLGKYIFTYTTCYYLSIVHILLTNTYIHTYDLDIGNLESAPKELMGHQLLTAEDELSLARQYKIAAHIGTVHIYSYMHIYIRL